MKRTVKYMFRSHAVVTDITGNVPRWTKHCLPYAKAERIDVNVGIIISQYYSHFLFFLEVVEFDIHTDLQADYLMEDTSLFLFIMLEGNILFHKHDGEYIAEAKGDVCYATYNRQGLYSFTLPAGRHRLCYIIPRNEWVTKNIGKYPRLEPFLDQMGQDNLPFGHMPSCRIEKGMERSLDKLLGRTEIKDKDLEAALLRDSKRVLYHYQLAVEKKMSARPYLIKENLDQNYRSSDLTNKVLMDRFNITEKTLIETFKAEFGITPHNYLIQLRMQMAKQLLLSKSSSPTEVWQLVGYADFRSFGIQFKKFFGFPPSECI
ncbi:helix-turn-helix domain-containing protein [Sphingobacterium kyonggiense]|uniref:helix-turn-helix domain-containing protein n=1 Tax=Sphingobacterium kyonggiense TaxID=714075 RepID=UPI0031CF6163